MAYFAGIEPGTDNGWVNIGESVQIILHGQGERRAKEESGKNNAASLHICSRTELQLYGTGNLRSSPTENKRIINEDQSGPEMIRGSA